MDKCKIFKQAGDYIKALRYGYPSKAVNFLVTTKKLALRDITKCVDPCAYEDFPYPTCCRSAYLTCGATLSIGDVGVDYKILVRPKHGNITTTEGIVYTPFEGYIGEDSFLIINNGRRYDVCVQVNNFSAELVSNSLGQGLVERTVDTECDAEYFWHDGSNAAFNVLGTQEPYSVRAVCDGCVLDFTECFSCVAQTVFIHGNSVVKAIHAFGGEVKDVDVGPALVVAPLNTFIGELEYECGEPYAEVIRNTIAIYDTPPLIEKVVIDFTPFEGSPSAIGINYWFGGICYPRNDFEIEWSNVYNEIEELLGLAAGSFPAVDISDIDNWATISNFIRNSIIAAGYLVGTVSVSSFNNQNRIRITETNAPLGRAVFLDSTGVYSLPSSRLITSWTKM